MLVSRARSHAYKDAACRVSGRTLCVLGRWGAWHSQLDLENWVM